MSSILKVDQLQDSGGNNLVTSNGSGVITAAGFGKIGQVLTTGRSSSDSDQTITAASYTDMTNMSLSITPTSTSSKVLIVSYFQVRVFRQSSNSGGGSRIVRDSTTVFEPKADGTGPYQFYLALGGTTSEYNLHAPCHMSFLDTPATTSATTYKLQGRVYNSSSNPEFRIEGQSSLTLMEVLP